MLLYSITIYVIPEYLQMKTAVVMLTASLLPFALASCTSSSSLITAQSEGKQLFEDNCQRCHRYAEDLKEPQSFLEKTLHTGAESMPSFDSVLTEDEQKTLSKYLSNI